MPLPLGVLYNNWLHGVAKRFQKKFDDISAEFNFELGPEFEIAICKVLPWDAMVTEQVQTWKFVSSVAAPVRGTRFRTP